MSTQRIDLAIQAMSGTVKVSHLAAEHHVSREFVYQQKDKSTIALDEVFAATAPDDAVLFNLPVTKTWLKHTASGSRNPCEPDTAGATQVPEISRFARKTRTFEGGSGTSVLPENRGF